MELIEGKWYKNLGEKKDHIGKFDGWHSLNIISVSEYIYEGRLHGYSECFTSAYGFAEECPLSEIQQYLPDGHPDKEFVLPEKWCVKINSKHEGLILAEWANFGWYIRHGDGVNFINSIKSWSKTLDCNYTEITFEQFKKYVLKTKDMEEKEIIGYKLKDNKYAKNVKALLNAPEFDFQEFEDNRFKYTIALKELRDAGVLDLWFEPVFKEKFKVGDWVMETWASSPYYNLKAFRIISINDDYATYNRQGECKSKTSSLRLATSEEIKKTLVEEAIKRGFKGGVKIDKTPLNYGGHTMFWTLSSSSSGFIYEPLRDELQWSASQDIVYRNGNWAEILPSYPQIEINGYKGEFFDTYVKFGCAEISKEVFIDLYTAREYKNTNRDIESVTIGKGTFSKEQIKLIAYYYLNKK